MELIKVTRHEEFEAAHLLPRYDGPCGNLHGHSYKLELTLKMIKEIVPDHKFMVWKDDEISMKIVKVLDEYGLKYMLFPHATTAENMVADFATMFDEYIHNELNLPDVHVYEINLWETANSHATWKRGK